MLSFYAEERGLSGIVRLNREWTEESHGYQNEHLTEEFVCRTRDGEHRHIKIYWHMKIMRGTDTHILVDEAIPEAEYERLRQENGTLDTPAYYEARAKRAELQGQLDALTPTCPKCHQQMVGRRGKYGDFWGCNQYPRCDGTRRMTDGEKAKRDDISQKSLALLAATTF